MSNNKDYEMKEFYNDIVKLLEQSIKDNVIENNPDIDDEYDNIILEYKKIRSKYSDEFIGLFTKNYGLLLPDLEAKVRIEDLNINTTAIDTLIADLFNKLEGKIDKTGGEFNGEVKALDYKPIYETNNGVYPEPIMVNDESNNKSQLATLNTMKNYLEHLLKVDIISEKIIMSYYLNIDFEADKEDGKYDENVEIDNRYELTDSGTLYIKYNGNNTKAIMS